METTADPVEEILKTDPTLAGNRLESMFKAVGFPPCGGCGRRRDWINLAHLWLRSPAEYDAIRERFRSDVLPILAKGVFSPAEIVDKLSQTSTLELAAVEHWLRQLEREGALASVEMSGKRLYGLPAESGKS